MDAPKMAAAGLLPDGTARATVRHRRAGRAEASLREALSANHPAASTEVAGK